MAAAGSLLLPVSARIPLLAGSYGSNRSLRLLLQQRLLLLLRAGRQRGQAWLLLLLAAAAAVHLLPLAAVVKW
jgi:hypothetical protein